MSRYEYRCGCGNPMRLVESVGPGEATFVRLACVGVDGRRSCGTVSIPLLVREGTPERLEGVAELIWRHEPRPWPYERRAVPERVPPTGERADERASDAVAGLGHRPTPGPHPLPHPAAVRRATGGRPRGSGADGQAGAGASGTAVAAGSWRDRIEQRRKERMAMT